MKIVINDGYGGFGLSDKGQDLYAKKSGFELFRYFSQLGERNSRRAAEGDYWMGVSVLIKDMGDVFNCYDNDNDKFYWMDHDLNRDDPILIEVVEELLEKSSGRCANLKVVEIPDGVDWEIEEDDGWEHVAEKHRKWS